MYIVRCNDGTLYTGSTVLPPEQRVWEHNADECAGANYTSTRRPVYLAYSEEYERIDQAYRREKQVQGWSRAKKEALILGRIDELTALARGRTGRRDGVSRET